MSAKQGLLKWLSAFVAFDIVVLGAILAPQIISSTPAIDARLTGALTTFLAPPVLLLLNTLVPPSLKHALVFWRFRDVLPAHRAFTNYVLSDPRIDSAALRTRLGEFPTDASDQQNLWFKLYQRHKTEFAVIDAQRPFLIFRDVASLSFLLAMLMPVALFALGSYIAIWSAFLVFACQYILTALASRQAAVRFVCTVLSLESHAHPP
ncbi:MAG: hypothetical protein U0S76_08000 [Pseudoxanthomonas sp.]|nr:hypothetical protein [Pseudoxanthomonas sp.]